MRGAGVAILGFGLLSCGARTGEGDDAARGEPATPSGTAVTQGLPILVGQTYGGRIVTSVDGVTIQPGRQLVTTAATRYDQSTAFAFDPIGGVVAYLDFHGQAFASRDHGLTWTEGGRLYPRAWTPGWGVHGMVWDGSRFVAGYIYPGDGDVGHLATSRDGLTWSPLGDVSGSPIAVSMTPNGLLVVSVPDTHIPVFSKVDGSGVHPLSGPPESSQLRSVAATADRTYVTLRSIGDQPLHLWSSADLVTWRLESAPDAILDQGDWLRALPNGGIALVDDDVSVVAASVDLVDWTSGNPGDDQITATTLGPSALFAARNLDQNHPGATVRVEIGTSFDGTTWQWAPPVEGTNLDAIEELLYVGPR